MAPKELTSEKNSHRPLDDNEIALLNTYGRGPYATEIKKAEREIEQLAQRVNRLRGIKESGSGLAAPRRWDLVSDKRMLQEEQPLMVARCTKIIDPGTEDAQYEININHIGKGRGPYATEIKKAEREIKQLAQRVNRLRGIKESDSGLAAPRRWDLVSDRRMLQEEQPLLVARCTKIINPGTEDAQYEININHIGKFVVGLGDNVSPTDIEESMRVGVDRSKYHIQIPLPLKIDPSVTMMIVEEKPDITYNDIGGCKQQIARIRPVVEFPLLHPERYVKLGFDPPKAVLFYGPPGTGKSLVARAVANRTNACFIRVIGSELVQKSIGEGAKMVRQLFKMARSKKACIIFFDEVDAIGGTRLDDGTGGDNEVQRTMLEIVNQLDGFDACGNIKVIMATNRPDTLDPALLRRGRIYPKIEFRPPDLDSRTQIFEIHTRAMNCERDIRFKLLARLCPNATGAEIRSVCTEAGMFAIRARRKNVTEADFLDAVRKVIKLYEKFSATPTYMAYN